MKILLSLFAFSISMALFSPLHAQEISPESPGAKTTTTTGSVARALFTTAVADRESVDEIKDLKNDANKIFFFTDIKGLAGQTITHRWEYKGQVMFEISFNIGASRWRVWSNKTLDPGWLGEWKVSVVDSTGNAIAESSFTYTKAGQ